MKVSSIPANYSGFTAAPIPAVAPAGFYFWLVLFVFGGAFCGPYTCALTVLGEDFEGGVLGRRQRTVALTNAAGGIAGPPVAGALMEWISPEAVSALFVLALVPLAAALSFWREIS